MTTKTELLPCPFCGAAPIFPEAKDIFGTCYDAGCADCGFATISIQIIDCFDYPRDHVHNSWDRDTSQYGIEFIEIARQQAIEDWNTRLVPPARAVGDEVSVPRVLALQLYSLLGPAGADFVDDAESELARAYAEQLRALLAAAPAENEITLRSAPIGTKAPAVNGGHWTRVERGWKWGATGNTFPTPGADWTGELISPMPSAEKGEL